jgi:hypothetical protein
MSSCHLVGLLYDFPIIFFSSFVLGKTFHFRQKDTGFDPHIDHKKVLNTLLTMTISMWWVRIYFQISYN